MKKVMSICLALVMSTAIFAGCSSNKANDEKSSDAGEKTYTLKVGMVVTENDPMYKGALKLKESVEKRTNGKLAVQVYPSSQLGDTGEIMAQAKAGANVAVIADPGLLADYVPAIGIFGAPYIIDNFEEGRKLVQTDLFKGWEKEVADKNGIQILSFNWYQGDRHLLTNKPIKTPEDMKGLKIRTLGTAVAQETMKAFGAVPTSLAWAEVYPGLQQKVIDAAEGQYSAVYGARLHEVIKYVTKTSHFQLVTGLVTGNIWFNSLPEEYQKILMEEAFNSGDYASKLTIDSLADYENKMKEAGTQIVEVDKAPFKKAAEVVYENTKGYKELRDQVNKALGK